MGFLIALAAGALIGIERQQDKATEQRPSIGGIRTFPLIALIGALSAFVGQTMGVWPILGALIVVGSFLAVAYFKDRGREVTPGITTPVAALITFFLGVLALLPDLPLDTIHRYLLIIGSAGVVMAVLSLKEPLHQAIARVSDDDIYATAKFVILALVVLPLLPDRTFGPFHVLNPFNIGIMVVLIAGISFLGYVAARLVGPQKGLATTGILGGLVSSTAVTISMATQIKKSPGLVLPGTMAILGASSTMFARMLVIIGILDMTLLPSLAVTLGIMMVLGYAVVFFLYVRSGARRAEGPEVVHRNPFELAPALTFGILYAAVLVIAKAAQTYLGDQGLYVSSFLAGTTDVDAITLSIIRFHQEGLASGTAAAALTLAAMTNTLVKALFAAWLGGRALAMHVAPGMLMMVAAGGFLVWVMGS